MFLKSLIISTPSKIIREITFHKGINLIIDESEDDHITGNSVGKTTVLKLIDFCLGAKSKNIYEDPEDKKKIYSLVKEFLVNNEVLITLTLTENLDDENANTIVISRNFLSSKSKIIREINGVHYIEEDFEPKLTELLFPEHISSKPTLRQIISHNIRYKDLSINNTLKTLDRYTSDAEYETLHLFLLGCEFTNGNQKQAILLKIKQEDTFKKRLEKNQTKSAYEVALSLIENEITVLDNRKNSLNINDNFVNDLENLNKLKYDINLLSTTISKLQIRKNLIEETKNDLLSSVSTIDLQQLELIYSQAKRNIPTLQKSFEDMVNYHNQMIEEKTKYITKEIPTLLENIKDNNNRLNILLKEESELSSLISKSDSFEELESIIAELNGKYKDKGEYESIIEQLQEVDDNLTTYNDDLRLIDEELFSEEFESIVKQQLDKFNIHFTHISNLLYGEQYALKYDIITNRKGQKLYKFSAFNTNFSSGKKQGEISCFDIAYTFFADEENIPCMHFLLNDKKELMHDNQLVQIAELANESNIQFVASILKDKLPEELNNEDYFVVKLSENDKLFKIENNILDI
ncbi:MAG: hypothetical protein CL623_12245 [Arcobacter sp.]|nr:hypothetical protein [Arcobacter sp.]|tara:strand:- start:2706 stop:4436 length:1731 start_codon:yes stop_codon:yes gene_type:complete